MDIPGTSTRLAFLGDIAVTVLPDSLSNYPDFSEYTNVIANLEGPVVPPDASSFKTAVCSTDQALLPVLQRLNISTVTLANNHIMDAPEHFSDTLRWLKKNSIDFLGAGENLSEAEQPLDANSASGHYRLLNYGWQVVGCRAATRKKPGCNPVRRSKILKDIAKSKRNDPVRKVIVVFHWNYELEQFPQPANRLLARECIDAGADAIIGAHPHIASGAEKYRGKPIVYSCGNWLFPAREFNGFDLNFPPSCDIQLVPELVFSDDSDITCIFHWWRYQRESQSFEFVARESWDDALITERSPFRKMSVSDYRRWFKKNRSKKKMLPIYDDAASSVLNKFKDIFVAGRGKMIDMMITLGFKTGY